LQEGNEDIELDPVLLPPWLILLLLKLLLKIPVLERGEETELDPELLTPLLLLPLGALELLVDDDSTELPEPPPVEDKLINTLLELLLGNECKGLLEIMLDDERIELPVLLIAVGLLELLLDDNSVEEI